jgi:hypothetical protein
MSLPESCQTGKTPAAVVLISVVADVIGFCGKLLLLYVKCYGRCNTAFIVKIDDENAKLGTTGPGRTEIASPIASATTTS